jgi:hypothetical protein
MRRSIISKMLATGLAAIVFGTAVPTVCAVTIVNSGVNVLKNDTYQLEGGAAYTELKISGTLGNQNIYFVEADPGSEDLYFKLGLGGGPSGTITSKATTLNTANAYHAAMNDNVIAAVNGGFFYQSKNLLNASDQYAGPQVSTQLLSVPRGILMTGGEILCSQQLFAESPSGAASNAFGITADGTAVIGCPQIGITLNNHTKNTNTTADGLNRLPVNDAVILYNERLASSNYAMSDAVDYVVAVDTDNKFYNGRTVTGTIVSVENAAGLSPGRIVITARGSGKTRLSGYSVGDRVSVTASFIGDHTDAAKVSIWNDVQEAIGSIHLPILNGSITSAYADYAYHYGSSAIAITFDGKVIISANDAYNAGGSAGLQFRHMDDFWVTNLNVKDMLLLDGGGSTSIVANLGSGLQFRNYAADSSGQRSVTNTMMLLAKNDNHINTLDYPANAGATNAAVTVSVQRTLGDSQGLYIQGWSVHGRGVKGYQYKINNTQWMDLNAEYRADVAAVTSSYHCDLNAFQGTVPIAALPAGTHKIYIRGINGKDIAYDIGTINLTIAASADDIGTYRSHIDTFDVGKENGKITTSTTVTFGEASLRLQGWTLNQYGVSDIYYTVDDGAAGTFSDLWSRSDVLAAFPQYSAANSHLNAFRGNIDISGLSVGAHFVKIYAKNSRNATYVVAEISLNIVNSGSYINTLDTFAGQTVGNAVVYASTSEEYGTETLYVQGWSVSTARTISFQYNIDGGSWISLPGHYRNDVAAATPGYYADINAFDANINISALSKGTHKMLIRAHTSTGIYYQVAQITINIQ